MYCQYGSCHRRLSSFSKATHPFVLSPFIQVSRRLPPGIELSSVKVDIVEWLTHVQVVEEKHPSFVPKGETYCAPKGRRFRAKEESRKEQSAKCRDTITKQSKLVI